MNLDDLTKEFEKLKDTIRLQSELLAELATRRALLDSFIDGYIRAKDNYEEGK